MATCNATFFPIQNRSVGGGEHAIGAGKGAIGLTALTTSTSAQPMQRGGSTWVAPADGYLVVHADGALRVACGEEAARGASPVGHYVPASQIYPMSITAGQSVSAVDA